MCCCPCPAAMRAPRCALAACQAAPRYDWCGRQVRLDGLDIRELSLLWYRGQLALVSQCAPAACAAGGVYLAGIRETRKFCMSHRDICMPAAGVALHVVVNPARCCTVTACAAARLGPRTAAGARQGARALHGHHPREHRGLARRQR